MERWKSSLSVYFSETWQILPWWSEKVKSRSQVTTLMCDKVRGCVGNVSMPDYNFVNDNKNNYGNLYHQYSLYIVKLNQIPVKMAIALFCLPLSVAQLQIFGLHKMCTTFGKVRGNVHFYESVFLPWAFFSVPTLQYKETNHYMGMRNCSVVLEKATHFMCAGRFIIIIIVSNSFI